VKFFRYVESGYNKEIARRREKQEKITPNLKAKRFWAKLFLGIVLN